MLYLFFNLWEFLNEHAILLSAIATLILAIVAIYQMKLLVLSPRLKCDFNLAHPDALLIHFPGITKNDYGEYDDDPSASNYSYFFRLRICNNGKVSAKNVEVIIKDIKDEQGNSIIGFSLNNLMWSTNPSNEQSAKYCNFISPKTYQYCTLGSISSQSEKEKTNQYLERKINLKQGFELAVFWKSINKNHILLPGKYIIELVIGCENMRNSINAKLQLEFDGSIFREESSMFAKGISLQLL